MKLRAQITVILTIIFILNCIVIIGSAPSSVLHPILHFLSIVLGLSNLIGIAFVDYIVSFDYRKKM